MMIMSFENRNSSDCMVMLHKKRIISSLVFYALILAYFGGTLTSWFAVIAIKINQIPMTSGVENLPLWIRYAFVIPVPVFLFVFFLFFLKLSVPKKLLYERMLFILLFCLLVLNLPIGILNGYPLIDILQYTWLLVSLPIFYFSLEWTTRNWDYWLFWKRFMDILWILTLITTVTSIYLVLSARSVYNSLSVFYLPLLTLLVRDKYRFRDIVLIALILVGVIGSRERGIWLSTFIIASLSFVIYRRRHYVRIKYLVIFTLSGLLLYVSWWCFSPKTLSSVQNAVVTRFHASFQSSEMSVLGFDPSLETRILGPLAVITELSDKGILAWIAGLGTGAGTKPYSPFSSAYLLSRRDGLVRKIENTYATFLLQTGILGLMLYVGILIDLTIKLRRALRSRLFDYRQKQIVTISLIFMLVLFLDMFRVDTLSYSIYIAFIGVMFRKLLNHQISSCRTNVIVENG